MKAKKQLKTPPQGHETWTQQITRYQGEGVSAARRLWRDDPVVSYQKRKDLEKDLHQKNIPERDRKKLEGALNELKRLIENDCRVTPLML